jgi:hypothetical protein
MTNAQEQQDRVAFDAFMLAVRVLYVAFDLDVPATEFERPFQMLRELADGKLTVASPGELAARFPEMSQFIYDRSSSIIESDRETAARVLRGLNRAL